MGATVVMVVMSLDIVLGLILVLLAELYCSLLLRRRKMMRQRQRQSVSNTALPTTVAAMVAATNSSSPQTNPLSRFYSPGVLHAPRNLLFPLVYCKETDFETGILSSSSPVTSSVSSPIPVPETSIKIDNKKASGDDLLYISNPVYDNDQGRGAQTPFETPETSPSRLEGGGSSDEEDDDGMASLSSPVTPPLTPMKKLPAHACSVSLGDTRSLAASSNDSNSNNGVSSSSSGSLRTSPSW